MTIKQKAYKFRLYPNEEQKQFFLLKHLVVQELFGI